MKRNCLLLIVALCCFLNSHAQKDKTLTWLLPQQGYTGTTINSKSFRLNQYFYAEQLIAPTAAKTLNLRVNARIASETNNHSYAPFNLQVKTRKGDLLNEVYNDGTAFVNMQLKSTDTVALIFVADPPVNDSIKIECSYIIADTAALTYQNMSYEATFAKMLERANVGFINMYNNSNGEKAKIDYPDGLFANGPAELSRYYGGLIQYIGQKLSKQEANKKTADWNKQVKTWLTDYNVTDIKTFNYGDVNSNTDAERTIYTKVNAAGMPLFKVNVSKESIAEKDSSGTKIYPYTYTYTVKVFITKD